MPCVKLVFAANYATERASLWQIVSARYSYEHGAILSRSLSAQHVLDPDSLCPLPLPLPLLLLVPHLHTHLHTHLLHAVSIYGQSEILIKCQRQLSAPPPPPTPAACASLYGLRLLVLLDFDFGFEFFFWFEIWFVWHLVQISFICGFGVNVPQQMHFWYAYISVYECVWGMWGCVRECVLVCERKQIWALTCALLVLSDTDTATWCSRIQSTLWFVSCYKFPDWHDNCQLSHDKWQWRQLEYDTRRLVQLMSRMYPDIAILAAAKADNSLKRQRERDLKCVLFWV